MQLYQLVKYLKFALGTADVFSMNRNKAHPLGHWSLLTLLTIASVTSCEKFSRLIYFKQGGLIPASEMKVTKISPLVAKPGDEVTVTGVNLNGQTVLRLGDQSIIWSSYTGDTAKFIMPKTSHPGAFAIKVGRYNDPSGAVAPAAKYMISDSADDEYPIYMATADQICSPTTFRDAEGALQVGTKNCDTTGATTSLCTADGGSNCVVDGSTYKAAKLSNFDASKIISGTTIAGVNGTASSGGSAPPNCSSAGQQDCKATGTYFAGTACTANSSACYLPTYAASAQPLKAINYDTINSSAASIRSGITLKSYQAGVTTIAAALIRREHSATMTTSGRMSPPPTA